MEITKEMVRQLTPRDWLHISATFIRKMAEIEVQEIEQDIARMDSLDEVDQMYLRAYYWSIVRNLLPELPIQKVAVPASTREELETQYRLMEEVFHIKLG